jgi:hypothetical protein
MTDKWKDGYKEGRVRFSCTKLYEEHRVEFWLDRTNIYSVRTEPAGLDDQLVAYLVARAIKSLFKKNTKTKLVEPLHPDLGVLQLRYSIHGARDHHCKKLPQPPRQLEGTDLVFHDPESIYGAQPCCFKCDQSMAPDGLNTSIKLMKPGAGERPCWLAAVRVKCNNGEYCAGRTGGLRAHGLERSPLQWGPACVSRAVSAACMWLTHRARQGGECASAEEVCEEACLWLQAPVSC